MILEVLSWEVTEPIQIQIVWRQRKEPGAQVCKSNRAERRLRAQVFQSSTLSNYTWDFSLYNVNYLRYSIKKNMLKCSIFCKLYQYHSNVKMLHVKQDSTFFYCCYLKFSFYKRLTMLKFFFCYRINHTTKGAVMQYFTIFRSLTKILAFLCIKYASTYILCPTAYPKWIRNAFSFLTIFFYLQLTRWKIFTL